MCARNNCVSFRQYSYSSAGVRQWPSEKLLVANLHYAISLDFQWQLLFLLAVSIAFSIAAKRGVFATGELYINALRKKELTTAAPKTSGSVAGCVIPRPPPRGPDEMVVAASSAADLTGTGR